MSIWLEKTNIAAVSGGKDNESNKRAKTTIVDLLQKRKIVLLTVNQKKDEKTGKEEAVFKIGSTDSVKEANKQADSLEIRVFEGDYQYRVHLSSKIWQIEGRNNNRPLDMAYNSKLQFDVLPGDNILTHKGTKKQFVITISPEFLVTVSCKKETFEFPPLPEEKAEKSIVGR